MSIQRKKKAESSRGNSLTANFIARGELIQSIQHEIRERGWTQSEAAEFLEVAQPRISNLMQGRVDQFTVDMLMMWLERFGKDVSISVRNNIFGTNEKIHLTLYVLGVQTETASQLVAQLFNGNDAKYELTIVNVLDEPEKARQAKVTATPCLVKESPAPRTVFVGDLSSASIRWQIAAAEQQARDDRDVAQDLRQVKQDERQVGLDLRQARLDVRESQQ